MHNNINYLKEKGWTPTNETNSEMRGLCPYHEETRPSFSINKNTGSFNCKSCGKGGRSLVTLMMFVEKKTKEEVISALYKCDVNSDKYKVANITYDFLKLAYESGVKKKDLLMQELTKRNLPEECLEKYKIGYSSSNISEKLLNNYHLIYLYKAGLLKDTSFFIKDRIVIPFYSDNRLIGFSLRATNKQEPKYLNIYDKDNFKTDSWFAYLDRNHDEVFICEGIFDVITMREYGYNACGALGTAISIERMLLLKNFSTIYLVLDADKAGVNAVKKFINNSRNVLSLSKIKVVTLPTNKDPDECSEDEIATFVGKSMYAFDWLIDVYLGITPPEVFIIGIKHLRNMVSNYQKDEAKILNKMIDMRLEKYLKKDIKQVYTIDYETNERTIEYELIVKE